MTEMTGYGPLAAPPAMNDLMVMVDVDDPAMGANGTTHRMLMSQLAGRPKFDPLMFGAKGDGVNVDDAYIADAFAAAAALTRAGGIIDLGNAPNTFLINTPIAADPNSVVMGSYLNAISKSQAVPDVTCKSTFTGLAALADTGALATGAGTNPSSSVSVIGLSIDMSQVTSSTPDGIRLMTYGGWVYFCQVNEAPAACMHFASYNASNNSTTSDMAENRCCFNSFSQPGTIGILVDGVGGTNPSDGMMAFNIIRMAAINHAGDAFNSTGAAIDCSGADWQITHNHPYACPGDGIITRQSETDTVDHNFVDNFGLAGAATTTYHGIWMEGQTGGPASHVSNNFVWTTEQFGVSSTTYEYYALAAKGSSVGYINFTDNTADQYTAGLGPSWARSFAGNSGTLNVIESGTIICPTASVPTISSTNNLSGTVNLLHPGATCLNSGSVSVPMGVSSAYGTLTTLIGGPLIPGTAFAFAGVSIIWGGTFSGDTVNIQLTATWDDGSTTTASAGTVTGTETQTVTNSVLLGMYNQGRQMVMLQVAARTTAATTAVTCHVTGLAIAA
jgi:hypothetical protein